MDLVLLSLENYPQMEMCLVFQSTTIDKCDFLNIHKYMMTKNYIN